MTAETENAIIFDAVRPMLDPQGFEASGRIAALNGACGRFREAVLGQSVAGLGGAATIVGSAPPQSWEQLLALLTNKNAPALTDADFERGAAALGNGVTPKHLKASKKVEAPRGAFDDDGRPSILYERHVFSRNTHPKGRFNASHPHISALGGYGPGGYGAFSAQYGKLGEAFALEPEAAFEACSWGAFQVLGENAVALGYESAIAMALSLAQKEAAHLETYIRFVKVNNLAAKLGACRAGDPASCVPFVAGYNGSGHARFNYAPKFAEALR